VKRLLRDKANFGILEGFLSELLRQDILIEEVLESETNRETEDNKQIIADLLCKTTKQELVLIEIQYARQLAFFHRMAFGTAKIMTERLKKGADYNKVVNIYSVNLEHFNLGSGNDLTMSTTPKRNSGVCTPKTSCATATYKSVNTKKSFPAIFFPSTTSSGLSSSTTWPKHHWTNGFTI
jgi:hypothetical protein